MVVSESDVRISAALAKLGVPHPVTPLDSAIDCQPQGR